MLKRNSRAGNRIGTAGSESVLNLPCCRSPSSPAPRCCCARHRHGWLLPRLRRFAPTSPLTAPQQPTQRCRPASDAGQRCLASASHRARAVAADDGQARPRRACFSGAVRVLRRDPLPIRPRDGARTATPDFSPLLSPPCSVRLPPCLDAPPPPLGARQPRQAGPRRARLRHDLGRARVCSALACAAFLASHSRLSASVGLP